MSQQANSGNVRPQRQSSCSAYGRKNHPISNYDCEDDGAEAPGCLCWFLGTFGPLGFIVAAIIAKGPGVVAAIKGWLVSWGVLFVLWLIIAGLS